jgi:urease accessory protein
VDASLEIMNRDTRKQRGDRPYVFSNLKTGEGLEQIVRFIVEEGMLPLDRLPLALDRAGRVREVRV